MFAPLFKKVLTSFALLVSVASATFVFAHASLKSEEPAADSTTTAPKDLRLNFSEGVEDKFTKVSLTTNSGKTVIVNTVATDPDDKKVLIITPATPIAAGEYKVEWHAVSVDTHKSEGEYSFKVSP
ncbi:copper homeostasis periplasmic binding protein CopC [Pseudomonas sp. UMAB-08]|uniref:copper homeostasis periplasmic binding protein CopC n=1 Tax=Pseudomonas sp. UMAB-08 TaxID=1365375 RepID=UPI001C583182|nr:copper homeostasis periplasmic binding protein CopC [Pseudomonas sp. UMAB-08]